MPYATRPAAAMYGAMYIEPETWRANAKSPGGYAFDINSGVNDRMRPDQYNSAARINPASLVHPSTSAAVWILGGIVGVAYLNGRRRGKKK